MISRFRATSRCFRAAGACLLLSGSVGCGSDPGSGPESGAGGGTHSGGSGSGAAASGGGQGAAENSGGSGGSGGSGAGESSGGHSAGGGGAASGGSGGGSGGTSDPSLENPINITEQVPVLPPVECELEDPCVIGTCAADTHPCEGDFAVTSAAELDAVRECTSISGNLSITGTDLTTLAPLALVAVGGTLSVTGNSLLNGYDGLANLTSVADLRLNQNGLDAASPATDLNAFRNLRYVRGTLAIDFPFDLTSLDGLQLKAIGGLLDIRHAAKLADISALETLECAGGVILDGSNELTNLHGLENLKELGGLGLSDCSQLSDLEAVSHITTFPTGLTMGNLPLVTNLHAFSELVSVGSLSFDTMSLTNFVGLSKLEVIAKVFRLHRNYSFTSVEGLSSLEVIGDEFLISGDNGFPNFEGLESLRIIGDDITLDAAHNVESYQGLSGLEAVGGSPEPVPDTGFEGMTSLISVGKTLMVPAGTSLADLAQLEFVGGLLRMDGDFDFSALAQLKVVGRLWIYDTTLLGDLTPFAGATVLDGIELNRNAGLKALRGLHHDGAWGSLVLDSNEALDDLSALRGLTELIELTLMGPGPKTLTGLDDLVSVSDTLTLRESALVTTDGLDNLTTLGGTWIVENPDLESIDALRKIEETSLAVIRNNPKLPQCAAEEFVARVQGDGSYFLAYDNDDEGVCP